MKFYRVYALFLLFAFSPVYSQLNFIPGYVINTKGDTSYGKVDLRGDLYMGKHCYFKHSDSLGNGNIQKFNPSEIAEYHIIDRKSYISHEVKGEKVFLELLVKGRINLYYLRNDSIDLYFIQKNDSTIVYLPYGEEMIHRHDTLYLQKDTRYKSILIAHTKEVPELKTRIRKMPAPAHDNLVPIISDYHDKLCPGQACIVFSRNVPVFKANLQAVAGMVNYRRIFGYPSNTYPCGGILASIGMPRVNERLYLRTGVVFSETYPVEKKRLNYKIPIQLQYIHPKGIIRPKFAYGFMFYKPIMTSVSIMAGANVKLFESVYLTVDADFDFMPKDKVLIVPAERLSQSLLFGLCVQF